MKREINISESFKLEYALTKVKNKYKITCTEKNGSTSTEETTEVLFVSTGRNARKILNTLIKNKVFPCHLQEIIRELMC